MTDAIFMACSLGCWLLFGHKYRALRQAPAERKRVIRPILAASSTAAMGFLCATAAVGANLDRLIGIPNLASLVGGVVSTMMVCSLRVMILNWRHPPDQALRTTRWTVFSYGLVVVVLIVLFASSPTAKEHTRDFIPVFATTRYLAEYLVLFFVVYTGSMINISYLCRRWATDTPADQSWLRRGLRLISIGLLFPIIYGLLSLITVVSSWFGANLYHWAVAAPAITGPGVPICVAGLTIATWGPRLPAIQQWVTARRADLRDYRQLRPLWLTLKPIDPTMVHAPGSLRERFSLESRLFFRVIEINDWLHQLRAYRDPGMAQALARCGRDLGLSTGDILAATEVAHITTALVARTNGRPAAHAVSSEQHDTPAETSHAFATERARLVLTARALTCRFVNDVRRCSASTNLNSNALSTGSHPTLSVSRRTRADPSKPSRTSVNVR